MKFRNKIYPAFLFPFSIESESSNYKNSIAKYGEPFYGRHMELTKAVVQITKLLSIKKNDDWFRPIMPHQSPRVNFKKKSGMGSMITKYPIKIHITLTRETFTPATWH